MCKSDKRCGAKFETYHILNLAPQRLSDLHTFWHEFDKPCVLSIRCLITTSRSMNIVATFLSYLYGERSSISLNYFQKFSNIFKYFHTFFTSMENGSNSKGCYFPEEIFRSVIIKMYRFIFSVKMCENIWKCLKICENMAFSNIFKHFQTYRWTLSLSLSLWLWYWVF